MKPATLLILLAAAVLPALGGCSRSNVEVSATEEDVHQDLVREDEGGRALPTTRPRVVHLPPAEFPAPPEPGLAGLIMVRVLVGTDGRAVEGEVSQSLDPDLDAAALAAAMAGTYAPAREGEIPREAWISVPVRFPPEKPEPKR